MSNDIKIFAGTASLELGQKVAGACNIPLGKMETKRFRDGEIRVTFGENIRGCDVYLIQSCYAPADNYFELFLMIQAAKLASARKIVAMPVYFPMARQDRKDRPRVSVGSKLIANFIETAGATRVVSIDFHADQIGVFFNIPCDQLFSSYVFVPYIKSLNLPNLTFAAPDVGAAKKVAHIAGILKADMVMCHKHRNLDGEIDQMILIGDVKDKNVIIHDDIIDSGGTLLECADLLIKNGAASVRAAIIHPVLSGNAKQKMQNSNLVEVIVTDTIPLRLKEGESFSKFSVLSVSNIISEAIQRIHYDSSISEMFKY
jgi:ribose-phosphate pyrophosphokinase